MKAWVLKGIDNIVREEVNRPELDDDSVIVRVKAAGICGSDIPRIYKTGAHKMPLIPGHEFSGQIVEIGKSVNRDLLGRKAGIFPLIPCMKCEQCKTGKYEMCNNYNYLGSRCDGGFAEYVKVPAWNIIALPDNVSYETAAMLEPMAVAVHAIRRISPEKGKKSAVIGLGTIGLLITMFLKKMGIEDIIVVGNKELQRNKALELEIDINSYFKYSPNVKADYIFECVGRNDTINMAIDMANNSGNICFVGNPYSDIEFPKDNYWKILRKQLTVTGTWNSSYGSENDDWHYVVDCLSEGDIFPDKLITHNLSFDELEKGLRIMKDKTEEYLKIMIEV